ncbi:MAG: MgtC/SapB family protein, partial [Bradymonadaceae bacterium]
METLIDWSLVQSVVLSLALGGLIGLERQSHHEPEESLESIGVRTFALASLLGTLSPLSHQVTSSGGVPPYVEALPYVTGVGYLALIISFLYFEYSAREKKPGITTQVSALIVYVIGALVP